MEYIPQRWPGTILRVILADGRVSPIVYHVVEDGAVHLVSIHRLQIGDRSGGPPGMGWQTFDWASIIICGSCRICSYLSPSLPPSLSLSLSLCMLCWERGREQSDIMDAQLSSTHIRSGL